MSKGILQVHPPICDCPGCRISSPVNRGRLAEKRTIPLPPNRVPKKELASIFSSDDSEGSERAGGDHGHIKQEDELHYSIVRKSRDSDLSTIISNLHHSRQHGVPEGQSASDTNASTGHPDDLLVKGRSFSPNSSSNSPSDSKKSRSVSPKETAQNPEGEAGGSQSHMSPEEHYRRMMAALGDNGSYEEQQQRLYQLAISMGLPIHDVLRAQQEALAAAARNPAALEAHLPTGASSSSSSQRRKQGLPQHRDAHYADREVSQHPPPLMSPATAPPHLGLAPHLRAPFLGLPSALCQAPGYGFLQPAQAEIFVRQQEMLRKQNLARLEMSAELLRQKELENLHQQQLLSSDTLGAGLPSDHPALRSLQDVTEAHPLRHAMAAAPFPATPSARREGRSSSDGESGKAPRRGPPTEPRAGHRKRRREDRGSEGDEEDAKDSDSEGERRLAKSRSKRKDRRGRERDGRGLGDGAKENREGSGPVGGACALAPPPLHLLNSTMGKSDVKIQIPPGFLPPMPALQGQSLPFGFPYINPYLHMGSVGGLFMDGEDSAPSNPAEDVSKWSVEDVCGFISSLAGCAEYAQVARRIGRLFYMTGFPLAFPFPPSAAIAPPERDGEQADAPSLPLALLQRPPSVGGTSHGGSAPGRSSPKSEKASGSAAVGR
ncbi:sterile alpha motif domain-containing protein 11 isoform X2 [Stigmatopora argus]